MPEATLYVLDGTAALFRCYFGMNKVAAPDGTEVGGLLGLGQWIGRFLKDVAPVYVASVMDAPERTFRHDIFPEYKANRDAPPEDLLPQFHLAPQVIEALGVPAFKVPGYEADDIMATLARRGREAGIHTVLVTPDKDVGQLVGPRVSMMDPKDFAVQGEEEVRERLGVSPGLVPDLLALAGDSTDNVPGVRGVGPKTAVALIDALGSFEGIFANLDRVPELAIRGAKGVARKLADGRGDAELSMRLVRLHEEVPLPEGLRSLRYLHWKGPPEGAEKLFDRLGFHQPLRSVRSLLD